MTKLMNQSAFTQTAWFGGVKGGGERGGEVETLELLGLIVAWYIFAR